ncbi:guanylate cyclase [Leptospira wolffii]|uniref:7TM diverse intracellular signaling domain-containing protein n=1 Tax=Leptospira wolffii TaxID=409998 RepID=UPI00034BA70A|nr:7TM diverse intracellular signaling domain-containing protein [Leptospira wolffii]TGK62454.1 guanylate cyclase [Leptospira wolffii]TGK65997.1 guanylate cyclase [Leptospira wolffii]TGK74162.1 guanylate cyclase [Leptospira wolffii]TGL29021.1 guanylate cyclase [Leptospira wolffii]
MTRLSRVFPLLLILSFTPSLVAQQSPTQDIVLTDESDQYDIRNAVSFFVDKEKKETIESVRRLDESGKFEKFGKTNFGITNFAYWVRIPVKNRSKSVRNWYLEISHPVLDHVDFYTPTSEGYVAKLSGDKLPFNNREINHRNFIFELPLHDSSETNEAVFYLRVESESTISLPIQILSEKAFANRNATEQFVFGLYYGLIFVMALYNLFIFFTVRDLSYLFYVFYIVTFGLLQMSLNGLAFQFVWPDSIWLASYAPTFLIPLLPTFVILFSRYFLLTFQYLPKMDKFLLSSSAVGAILTVISLFVKISSVLWILAVYALLNIPFVLGCAIYTLRKGYRPAIYYLTAWLTLMFGGVLYGLKAFGVVPDIFLTNYGLQIGAGLEVVLLSFALASRINTIKKEKEEAQAKTLEMQKILTESYARFVPKDFLANLGKDSILDVKLGDQIQKEMAVLFSDIRSFTTLSEQMTPAQNFNFINSYLSRMSPIIQRHNGFIDKFIGDAIMALFQRNVIDAVSAGVEMQRYLKEYNEHRHRQGYIPIQIGVGIHSGSLMLGTIGAEERLEGTVISDTVNLASRIESLTKVYGSRIAVSESTVEEVKKEGRFNFRFLDRVKVKGKQKPVSVYEVFDGDEPEQQDLKIKTRDAYEKGVKAFYSHAFDEAKIQFEKVISLFPEDKATQLYLKRLYPVTQGSKVAEEIED